MVKTRKLHGKTQHFAFYHCNGKRWNKCQSNYIQTTATIDNKYSLPSPSALLSTPILDDTIYAPLHLANEKALS